MEEETIKRRVNVIMWLVLANMVFCAALFIAAIIILEVLRRG